jgi:hypothetical protein
MSILGSTHGIVSGLRRIRTAFSASSPNEVASLTQLGSCLPMMITSPLRGGFFDGPTVDIGAIGSA